MTLGEWLYNWLRENGRVNEHYEKGNVLSDSMIRVIHSAKPYLKDGKYVIELMLIYQTAPIVDGLVRELMDWITDVALQIKSELDDSPKLVIEMEYRVENDLGYSKTVQHALF